MKVISIIIPTLNESQTIESCLRQLNVIRNSGHEVIVVDGGSIDDTLDKARPLADIVIQHQTGRARQMNAGAELARGEMYLFLHADTILPVDADKRILDCVKLHSDCWGRFDVKLSGTHWLFRVIGFCMNFRTRITGIVTGDHGIFISRRWFEAIGGYETIDIMEDISISKRLRRLGRPVCLKASVITSSRRWEENGILRTIFKMWRLRLAYAMGVNPDYLVTQYE